MAGAGSYGDLASAYAGVRDDYRRLGELIAEAVRSDLSALHMQVSVETRPKEVISFVKKALRKGYDDPLTQIGDKAGVRVIVHYLADVKRVEEVVKQHCEIRARESKLDALDYDKLGYLGVHLQVLPKPELVREENEDLAELTAELQIHTKVQSAWAVVSHDLLYKAPQDVPSDLKRSITRLVALVELFDGEVARFQDQIRDDPNFAEMQVLEPLDNLLIEFSPRRPDKALSALVLPSLVRLCEQSPEEVFANFVKPFVDTHRAQLETIYKQYADDDRATPLLFQPEAFLIFACLETDPYRLRDKWPSDVVPIDLLDDLATIWGIDLEEPDT